MNITSPRSRFVLSSAGALASLAVLRSQAKAAQFEFKSANDAPVDHPESIAIRQLWDTVREETRGRLDVKVFNAAQLGSATALLGQVRLGAIQFYLCSGGVVSTVVPTASLDGVAFAFKTSRDAWNTFDGPLGDFVRSEIAAKGLIALDGVWQIGMRQITSATKPVRVADDLQGFKMRTPAAAISVDLFKTLGASTTTVDIAETYVALQTHVVDGQENPLALIEGDRFYEVQKYMSITNHMWGAKWLLGNPAAFNGLPADIQAIVRKNAAKYSAQQRVAVQKLDDGLQTKLGSQGLTIIQPNIPTFKAKLGSYYATWKSNFGPTAWGMLEEKVGKLG